MIEFVGKIGPREVMVMRVTNLENHFDPELGNYSVHLAVRDSDGTEHVYQRALMDYDRTRYNALGILKAVLDSLDKEVFEVERPDEAQAPVPADLARGLPRAMPEVP